MTELVILPYTAVGFSIVARFIFMYLLYTKRSTNIYSLIFCILSVISSSLWVPYGIVIQDIPIIVRSTLEIVLLTGSGIYIVCNRYHYEVEPSIVPNVVNENNSHSVMNANLNKIVGN